MATQTLPTRRKAPIEEHVGSSFAGSLLLHLAIAGSIIGYTFLPSHRQDFWGEHASQAGSIQATMVDALPLPPHQRQLDKGVLTSEEPSPAPRPPTPEAQPKPRPDEVLIPEKTQPKPKVAEKPAPAPPRHPQPAPPTQKANTGQTAGIQIAQVAIQTKNGTATVTVQEKSFGDRFPYYVNAIARKISENWYKQEADPRSSIGKKVGVSFAIARDGTVSDIQLTTRSGSPTLDTSATRALQRIDTFGPLPMGDHIECVYTFEYDQP